MRASRQIFRPAALPAALLAAALLAACGSSGVGDVFGNGRDTRTDDSRYDLARDVRGTVERVNTSERYIVVNPESGYREDLRNAGEDEAVLYYDERTTVAYQDRNFEPRDLEPGDRISAQVDRIGGRLVAQRIDVTYDVSSGGLGSENRDQYAAEDLRGVVRYNDTRARTLEVERSSGSDYRSNFSTGAGSGSGGYGTSVVQVRYDASTVVEFQGRTYAPEGLEQGDLVRIDLRDEGGYTSSGTSARVADRIVVLGENQPSGR